MEIIQENIFKGVIHVFTFMIKFALCFSFFFIRYSSQFQAQETESNHQELPCTIWTQTETTKKDQTIHVAWPEIAVEDI